MVLQSGNAVGGVSVCSWRDEQFVVGFLNVFDSGGKEYKCEYKKPG